MVNEDKTPEKDTEAKQRAEHKHLDRIRIGFTLEDYRGTKRMRQRAIEFEKQRATP